MWGRVRRGVVSSKSPSSFLLLPPALKKVPGPWRRDTPLPRLHCGRCTRCCLIVTRWTLTAQPALTMCLLDTAACGTSTPLRVPRAPEHHRLGGGGPGWTMRSSLQGTMRRQSGGTEEEGGGWRPNQATKRHCLFGHWLKKEKESLLSGAKRIRMRGVWTDGEVREGKDRTGEKPHSSSRRRWS